MTPAVRRSPIPPSRCHLAKVIDLLGDRWTLLVLRSSLFGVRRFDDFQSELGVPRTVLSGRLKQLVGEGLLVRQDYKVSGRRARPEYVLTAKGSALQPALIALMEWGDDWAGGGAVPPMGFIKAGTRERLKVAMVDASGQEVPVAQVRPTIRA